MGASYPKLIDREMPPLLALRVNKSPSNPQTLKKLEGFIAERRSECSQGWSHMQTIQNQHTKSPRLMKLRSQRNYAPRNDNNDDDNDDDVSMEETCHFCGGAHTSSDCPSVDDKNKMACKFCGKDGAKSEICSLSGWHLTTCPRWQPPPVKSCRERQSQPVTMDANLRRLSLEGCLHKKVGDECIIMFAAYTKQYEGSKQARITQATPLNLSYKEWRHLANWNENYLERNGRPYLKFNGKIVTNPAGQKSYGESWARDFYKQGEGLIIQIKGNRRIIKAQDIFHSHVEIYHDISQSNHIEIDYFTALGRGIC